MALERTPLTAPPLRSHGFIQREGVQARGASPAGLEGCRGRPPPSVGEGVLETPPSPPWEADTHRKKKITSTGPSRDGERGSGRCKGHID